MHAAGITCSQRLGDLIAGLEPAREADGGAAAPISPAVMITLAALEEITGASGIAPQIEAVLPIGVRSRQLRVRTLLAWEVPDPGRRAARPPHPRPPVRPVQPARARAAAARRDHRVGSMATTC